MQKIVERNQKNRFFENFNNFIVSNFMNFYVKQQIFETMIVVKTIQNSQQFDYMIMFDKYFDNLQMKFLNTKIKKKLFL